MKTLLLVNTGNDAEIIGESLTHNEKLFDKIVIMDRASKDGTVDIIKSLNNSKITIHVQDEYLSKSQPILNQTILQLYVDEYDYYVLLDADEFIVADNLNEFKNIPQGEVGTMPWKCYVPDGDVFKDFKKNITKRRTIEQETNYKIVIPTSTQCMLSIGNHYVCDYDAFILNHEVRLPLYELKTISLAHFPVRSRKQYNKKIEFFNNLDYSGLDSKRCEHLRGKKKITSIEQLRKEALHFNGKIDNCEVVYDPVK